MSRGKEISLRLLILLEKVTRKYLESPEKDTYTHYMSVTRHHCILVRYYHTGSAQKAFLTLKEAQQRGSPLLLVTFAANGKLVFSCHQYLNSLLRSLYLRLYHSTN